MADVGVTPAGERIPRDAASALFTIPRWQYTDEDGLTADVVWLHDAMQAVDEAGAAALDQGLDVDALAEAILRHDANDSWPSDSQVAHDRGHCGNNRCATAIAAEYARLASIPSPREPEPSVVGFRCVACDNVLIGGECPIHGNLTWRSEQPRPDPGSDE